MSSRIARRSAALSRDVRGWLMRVPPQDASPALFGKTFGTSTDLLQPAFKLLQLFWRDVLERFFDECRVPAKEREKHFLPVFSQSDGSHPTITSALDAADETFLV